MTSIQAEIDAKILYVALKALSAVVDEANLCFTHDGLSVRQLDMAEVSMVDLFVPRGIFESYDVEQEKHVAAIRISDVLKLFKRPKKDDRVAIMHRGENMLALALRGDKNFTFKVPVLPGDGKELPTPKVSFTEAFTARTKAIGDFLDGAKKVTDSVCFDVTQNGATVNLVAKGEVSDVSQQLTRDDGSLVDCDLRDTVKASYDLTKLLKFFQKDFGETAFVEFARDLPLRITYSLSAGDLFRERGQVVYYVAPKVCRDEPPKEAERGTEEPKAETRVGESLQELNMKPGAAEVYRIGDRIYGFGDYSHCDGEDITHNLKVLKSMLLEEDLGWIGKAYDADMYRGEEPLTGEEWEHKKWEATTIDHEEMKDITDWPEIEAEEVMPEQPVVEQPVEEKPVTITTTLPSELEQAKEIVKEVLGTVEQEPKVEEKPAEEPIPALGATYDGKEWHAKEEKPKEPEPVPVAVDPLEAFRKKFAKKP